MALSRGVPKREKPRNEARSADYTGKVAVPPPLLSFFLKYAPPTFSTSSTFRAAREGCVCVYMYACQGQDPIEENEGKKFPPLPRIENACFLSMIHRTRLPMFITNLSLPKPTNLVFKIVFKFMRGTIPAPLLPTESLSVIGGTGARCLFAQLVVQTILLSPPPLFLPPVDIAFSAFRRN